MPPIPSDITSPHLALLSLQLEPSDIEDLLAERGLTVSGMDTRPVQWETLNQAAIRYLYNPRQ